MSALRSLSDSPVATFAAASAAANATVGGPTCTSGRRWLSKGARYPFSLDLVLPAGGTMTVQATVHAAAVGHEAILLPAAPAEWFEQSVDASEDHISEDRISEADSGVHRLSETSSRRLPFARQAELAYATVSVHGIEAVCRAAAYCAIQIVECPYQRHSAASTGTGGATPCRNGASNGEQWKDALTFKRRPSALPPPQSPPLPSPDARALPAARSADHPNGEASGEGRRRRLEALGRRQLESVCGVGSCCAVIYRGPIGALCTPVPVWDLSGWSHPGGAFVTRSSLCNSVRFSWLAKSGQHAAQMNPEDAGLTSLSGGGVQVGRFVDPACGGDGGGSNLTQLEQGWSSLRGLPGFGANDSVILPPRAQWVLNANMTVATLTIRGSLRWDTSMNGLVLMAGYIVIERGGRLEVGTAAAPMLLRATIYIRHLTNASHPYLGSRFLALDGLAASTLDAIFLQGGGAEMETITVTLDDPTIEPGQTVTVLHDGRDVEITVPQDVVTGQPFQVQVRRAEPPPSSTGAGGDSRGTPSSPPIPMAPPTLPPVSPPRPSVADTPPVMDIHGRPLEQTWTLLARSAPAGGSQLILKHEAASMGWRVGDGVGMATTQYGKVLTFLTSSTALGHLVTLTAGYADQHSRRAIPPLSYFRRIAESSLALVLAASGGSRLQTSLPAPRRLGTRVPPRPLMATTAARGRLPPPLQVPLPQAASGFSHISPRPL